MATSIAKFYRVKDTSELDLKIEIGQVQKGITDISLGDKKLIENFVGDVSEKLPGKGEDLKGKTMFCHTMVIDVRDETNETSVTYKLTGGRTDFKETLQESVEEHGTKHYVAVFTFTY